MSDELRKEIEQFNLSTAAKEFAPAVSRKAGIIELRGKRLVDFTSWDCFRLNESPALKRAAQHAIEQSGFGASASRALSGTRQSHLSCEARIAAFLGTESALLFSSRNQVILSLITALTSERDTVLSDELSQSPVADACYLSGAQTLFFDSTDPASLEAELKKLHDGRKFVFIESTQGVTGKVCPIDELAPVCAASSAALCVDESFSLGLVGNRGAGMADLWPLSVRPLVQYCDASLCLCGNGAFLAGPAYLTNYIASRSRTFSSECAPCPASAAWLELAIEIIEVKLLDRQKLYQFADKLRRGFEMAGLTPFPKSNGPIVCLAFDTLAIARKFESALVSRGFLAEALSCPTFLENRAALRFIPNIGHSQEQLQELLEASSDIWKRLNRK